MTSSKIENNNITKVSLLGLEGSGKTCLMRRITTNLYNPNTIPTIRVDFQGINTRDEKLQVWDFAGGLNGKDLAEGLRGTKIVAFAYDLSHPELFVDLLNYIKDVLKIIEHTVLLPQFVIVATKSDNSQVSKPLMDEHIGELTKLLNTEHFIATSAQDNVDCNRFKNVLVKLAGDIKPEPGITVFIHDEPRQQLINKLNDYLHRIENYQPNLFQNLRARFFKDTQSANRKANYILAKKLRDDLLANKNIDDVFSDINKKRLAEAKKHNSGMDANELWLLRKQIYSTELNNVIRDGRRLGRKSR